MKKINHLISLRCVRPGWAVLALTVGNPAMALAARDPVTMRWTPGIGDPTVYGWITTMAYLGAAALLFANLRLGKRLGFDLYFWLAAGLLMFFLGINKQLDLQTWFTQMGRDMARSQGWYDNRRIVQSEFIALLFVAGSVALLAMRRWVGKAWKDYRLCGLGLIMISIFIMIRAVSIHHVDQLLRLSLSGLRVNVVLELGGIALVVAGAVSWRRVVKRETGPLGQLMGRSPGSERGVKYFTFAQSWFLKSILRSAGKKRG